MRKYKIIEKEAKPLTASCDVIQLMRFQNIYSPDVDILLCKTYKMRCDRSRGGKSDVFFLIEDSDKFGSERFPVLVTEKAAQEILNNPEKGLNLFSMVSSDRSR